MFNIFLGLHFLLPVFSLFTLASFSLVSPFHILQCTAFASPAGVAHVQEGLPDAIGCIANGRREDDEDDDKLRGHRLMAMVWAMA